MRLKEYDWDKQNFVERSYPDEPIAEFVNFFRTTKAWVGDPERVHRKVLVLDRALAAHREDVARAQAVTAALMTAPTPPAVAPAQPKKKGGRRAAQSEGR